MNSESNHRNTVGKRYLGIDYGTKRVGIAVSDPEGQLAFPHVVLKTTPKLAQEIADICRENSVGTIVMGESKDYSGKDNNIMPAARDLTKDLEKETGVTVIFHPEFMTSMQAAHIQGEGEMLDASAAAIMLQSYLDLNENKGSGSPALASEVAKESTAKISYEDFSKVELKVGRILSAEPIPKSDKLLKLSVDFAEGQPRQILSGIAKYFPDPSKLVDRKCMFVTNLAPRKMMGMESDGMILAVSTDDEFSLLEPNGVNGGVIPVGTKAK